MIAPTAAAPAAKHSAPNAAGAKAAAPEYNGNLLVADIVPDPENRKEHVGIAELAESIKTETLLQPIVVRPCPQYPRASPRRHVIDKKEIFRVLKDELETGPTRNEWLYETTSQRDADRAAAIYRSGAGWQIIAGERRWEAHRLNKAETIRAFIHRGETDVSAAVKQTIENLGRKDLNPIEEARQMKRLADMKVPQAEIGKLFGGRSQPVVSNTMRLLELPAAVQAMITSGKISHAHGVCLAAYVKWPKVCEFIADHALKGEYKAKDLAEGIGYTLGQNLVREKLGAPLHSWDFIDRKVPTAVLKDPNIIKTGDELWCFSWARYQELLKPLANARKAEQAAQVAQRAKAKTTDKGEIIAKELEYLAVLLPEEKRGKRGGNLVALDSGRWREIVNAANAFLDGQAVKVITAAAKEALQLLIKAKTVTPQFAAVLFSDQDADAYCTPATDVVVGKLAKSLGIKCDEGSYAKVAKIDTTQLVKLQIAARLEDIAANENCYETDKMGELLCVVLGRQQLGFLDESVAGRQQVIAHLCIKLKIPPLLVKGAVTPPSTSPKKKGGKAK